MTFTSRLNYAFLAFMLILLLVLQFVFLCVILAYLRGGDTWRLKNEEVGGGCVYGQLVHTADQL